MKIIVGCTVVRNLQQRRQRPRLSLAAKQLLGKEEPKEVRQ